MDETFSRIVNKGHAPSRQDIADLLATIGPPGDKRVEKTAEIRRLFDELGLPAVNSQGFHAADDLTDFAEW